MTTSNFEKTLASATRVEPSPEVDACVLAAIGLESARRARRRTAAKVLAAAVGAVLLSVANFRFAADSSASAVQVDDAGDIMLDIIGLASSADLYDISDADDAEEMVLGLL